MRPAAASSHANLLEQNSVYIRKKFSSHKTGLVRQRGRRVYFSSEHQYGCRDVMLKRSITSQSREKDWFSTNQGQNQHHT